MDVHQRMAGTLMAVMGGTVLLGLLFTVPAVWLAVDAQLQVFGPGTWPPGLDGGWGLLLLGMLLLQATWGLLALAGGVLAARQRGGRRLLMPAAVLALVGFPIGTAIGLYTLWAYWRQGMAAQPVERLSQSALR